MAKPEDLMWYIISSSTFTAFVVILFSVLIYKQFKMRIKQQDDYEKSLKEKKIELINAVVKAQEDERAQIARNLHDEVGATLSMTKQKLFQASNYFQSNSDAFQEILAVTKMIDLSVSRLRDITNRMLPHYLLKFGLKKSVDRLFEQAQESIGKPCLVINELPIDITLTQDQEIQLYFVISELLNNFVKHAKPNFIDGSFECMDGHFILSLNHDGVAINQSDYEHLKVKKIGIGLSSIYHRVSTLNGTLTFKRNSRGGSVTINFPYQSTNE